MRKAKEITRAVDLDELKQRERETNDAQEKRRLMGIRLKIEGYSVTEIMKIMPVTQSGLLRWVDKFNEKGFDGLKSKPIPGKAAFLNKDQIEVVRLWLDEGPGEKHDCYFWTGKKLLEAIEREFGASYSLNGIYKLLKTLGYTRLVPKTRHYKSDPARAEEFKKNFRVWSRQ